jgi:hypothetical protein
VQQSDLWHDTVFDALGAAAQAAGGTKKVASKLWSTLDSTSATSRLRAGLNVDHQQKLCLLEAIAIARLGKEAGCHAFMQYLARDLGYEIKPLAAEDAKKRVRRDRRLALLEELKLLEDEE